MAETLKTRNEEEKVELKPGMHPSYLNILIQKREIKEKTVGIKHRIGVYSAKGGVGKTTVAVNLAYALKGMGLKVGLLDADIDCPNIPFFLGMNNVVPQDYPIIPVEKDGLKIVSTGMFLEDKEKPIIWRGPMKSKMLREFFENTSWGELDYIIIDLPPGTSDTPLSPMQLLSLDGIILVTTPQTIAAKNAIRSGMMAKRMNVSILGIVETMSGAGLKGAKDAAEKLNTAVLGSIRYSEKFDALSDSGKVPFIEDKEIRDAFTDIAKKIDSRLK